MGAVILSFLSRISNIKYIGIIGIYINMHATHNIYLVCQLARNQMRPFIGFVALDFLEYFFVQFENHKILICISANKMDFFMSSLSTL